MRLISLVTPSSGLRQGDVLSLLDGEFAPYGAKHCVVITADCDLAQGKHYGHVLLCPIISASSYYEELWCAKRLESFREKTLGRLRREFDDLAVRGVLRSPLSEQAFEVLCSSEGVLRESVAALGLPAGKIDALAHQVASLEQCAAAGGNLLALATGAAHNQRKSVSAVREKLLAEFKADLARDAIDVVVVHDDLTGNDLVHVVLLRAPFSVPAEKVQLDMTQKMHAACCRVGRFAPEIKFLIAQKFGTLFSRVGMKNEIEVDRNAAIELLEDIV